MFIPPLFPQRFDIIQEEEDPEGFKAAQEDQMEIIKAAVEESRNTHHEVMRLLKSFISWSTVR